MMAKDVRVDRKFLEQCYDFIGSVATRDFRVGRMEDYALARQILNRLIRILDTE
jgi:hypothetical protein